MIPTIRIRYYIAYSAAMCQARGLRKVGSHLAKHANFHRILLSAVNPLRHRIPTVTAERNLYKLRAPLPFITMIRSAFRSTPQPFLDAAFMLEHRVACFRERVRAFYFAVVLFQRPCTRCEATDVAMLRDSWCKCGTCGQEFDPTVTFQSCPECDGPLLKRICHYWCPTCRKPVRSLFTFDVRVFDADYFRDMMCESRARKAAKADAVRKMLAESRSAPFTPCDSLDDNLGAFTADLDQYVSVPAVIEQLSALRRPVFDMDVYRQHILDLVQGCVVDFEGISAVVEDGRLDRVFRFIAVVFMEQDGLLVIHQDHSGLIRLCGK